MVMEESTCLSNYAEIPVAIIGNFVSNFRYFYLTLNIIRLRSADETAKQVKVQ